MLYPPTEEGWGVVTYICVRPQQETRRDEPRLKRKTESDIDMYSKNIKVTSKYIEAKYYKAELL